MSEDAPKKGPGRATSADARKLHLARVSELVLRNKKQVEIAAELGVTRQAINYDIKVLRRYWAQSTLSNTAEHITRMLRKLELVEAEFWTAWDKSVTEEPDPRFMQGVLACLDKQAKLMGLDAPIKIAPTTPDGTAEYGITNEQERRAWASSILERLVNAHTPSSNDADGVTGELTDTDEDSGADARDADDEAAGDPG